METTPMEKEAMLKKLDKMAWSAANRCGSKKPSDIEEVHNTCLMAISRAIDDYKPLSGTAVAGFAFRYSEQARRNWYKMNVSEQWGGKQRRMENSVVGYNDEYMAMVSDEISIDKLSLSIVIEKANRDEVINERIKKILLYRIDGLTRPEIGKKIGLCESRIGQLEREGIRKIREEYEGMI